MNKQKGQKKTEAYFTGIINMLIEANAEGYHCDYDPRELTCTVTVRDSPLRTLARRVDGACPRAVHLSWSSVNRSIELAELTV